MNKNKFFGVGMVAVLLIFGLVGCDMVADLIDKADGDPLSTAKAELQTAIDAAAAAKNAIGTPSIASTAWVEGTQADGTFIIGSGTAGSLPVGLYYTAEDPTSAITAYGAAITAAQAALAGATTAATANTAKANLAAATTTFNAALGTAGTKSLKDRIAAAVSGTTIYLYGNESITGLTDSAGVDTTATPNITKTITLKGVGVERTITLSSPGLMFYLGSNGKLTLDDKVTLKGIATNTRPVVIVNASGAELTMKDGSKITGNTSSTRHGDGGSIGSGSSSGVRINEGTFNMTGGEISNNHSLNQGGGGVLVFSYINKNSTFTMSGGTISGNTASRGAGVYLDFNGTGSSTFTMSDGTISGNTAADTGGGVQADSSNASNSTFTMSGGTISGNTARGGGGVYVKNNGTGTNTFTMSGVAAISNNSAGMIGGGVYVKNDGTGTTTFTMNNGAVSSNTAPYGGGVTVLKASFSKTGGAITGNTATIFAPTNTVLVLDAEDEAGTKAYRNTDAGATDNITATWKGISYTTLTGLITIP